MGTRNLTKVIDKTGKVVVAQYGQWDGYPSGQGINALLHAYNYRQIEKNLDKCVFLTDEELDQINGSLDPEKSIAEQYPTLSRDTCADILGYVAWATGKVGLVDSSDFEQDELFCEGVYTIDFVQKRLISTYGGHTLYHELEDLPEPKEYLAEWATELDPGTAG